MKKKQIITLFLLLFGTVISAQTKEEIIKHMIEEVTYLASDELEGRATGTDSEKLAADFIGKKFLEYNLLKKGDKDYLQLFTATIKENPHSQQVKRKIEGINVVGFKDNNKERDGSNPFHAIFSMLIIIPLKIALTAKKKQIEMCWCIICIM